MTSAAAIARALEAVAACDDPGALVRVAAAASSRAAELLEGGTARPAGCATLSGAAAAAVAARRGRRGRPEPLDPEAVVSPTRAAAALPWRRADALAWLRRQNLIRRSGPSGRRCVVWGDVLAALRAEGAPTPLRRAHPLAGIVPLDA